MKHRGIWRERERKNHEGLALCLPCSREMRNNQFGLKTSHLRFPFFAPISQQINNSKFNQNLGKFSINHSARKWVFWCSNTNQDSGLRPPSMDAKNVDDNEALSDVSLASYGQTWYKCTVLLFNKLISRLTFDKKTEDILSRFAPLLIRAIIDSSGTTGRESDPPPFHPIPFSPPPPPRLWRLYLETRHATGSWFCAMTYPLNELSL